MPRETQEEMAGLYQLRMETLGLTYEMAYDCEVWRSKLAAATRMGEASRNGDDGGNDDYDDYHHYDYGD